MHFLKNAFQFTINFIKASMEGWEMRKHANVYKIVRKSGESKVIEAPRNVNKDNTSVKGQQYMIGNDIKINWTYSEGKRDI